MKNTKLFRRSMTATVLVSSVWFSNLSIMAQDLVAVSSLTGGTSVFVFRSIRTVRRVVPQAKPTRTKAQRLESAVKIKKQYETTEARTGRTKAIEPDKLPANASRTLPAPQASKLFAGVGEYYLAKKDFDDSFNFFRDAINLDPTNEAAKNGYSEALAIKGNELLVNEKGDDAQALFMEAIKNNPKNAAAYFGLGEVYSEKPDTQKDAIANYEKSLENDKGLTEIYVPLGILYFQSGEIAKADDLLTKALASSQDSAETQFFLGLIRLSQNRVEDALAGFQKAKTIDPNYAEAFYNSGEALTKLKRQAEAIPDYQKAVSLKPNYFEAWVGLGEVLSVTGNYGEAINAYKSAAKLKNDSWEVYAGLAEALRQSKEPNHFNDAAANYNLAVLFLTRNPNFAKDTAADLYSKTGFVIGQQCDINMQKVPPVACNWPAAISALQKAADLSNDPIDYINLGWAYFRVGHAAAENHDPATAKPNLDSAKAALDKALATAKPPVIDYALQNLAAVQIDLGDRTGAISTLTQMLDKHPEENSMRYQLGVAYFKDNDYADAEKWFRAALDKDPNYVFAMTGLGETLLARKNGKELKKLIDRLRPLDADAAARLETKMKILRM